MYPTNTITEYRKGAGPMRTPTQNTADRKLLRLTRRIGSTTYRVSVHFSGTSRETIGDKILRLIQNEASGAQKTPEMTPAPHADDQVPQTAATAGKRMP